MNRSVSLAALSAVALIVLLAAGEAEAQRVGGYKAIDVADAGAVAAANFAVSSRSASTEIEVSLISIEHAERQVVAGSNYKLCLRISSPDGEDGAESESMVTAVVFVDLNGVSKLTSWEDSECGNPE